MIERTRWGMWVCPFCGDVNEDPEHVAITTCAKNRHIVHLSKIEKGRVRRALPVDKMVLSKEETEDVLRLQQCLKEDGIK